MKKTAIVFAILMIAVATAAFAVPKPEMDKIGVYFDELATIDCAAMLPDLAADAYLVLTGVTSDEILGWEAKVYYDNMFLLSFVPRGLHVDVGSRDNEHLVGFPSPVPVVDETVVLADISIMMLGYMTSNPSYMYISEVYFHLMDEPVPAYLDGANEPVAMNINQATAGDPVLEINGECLEPIAEETSSWGSVKSLFR